MKLEQFVPESVTGNESLISSLKENKHYFWVRYWYEHRVGGHF